MTIRRRADGSHYCDGRECGYELAWQDPDREAGDGHGLWVCLDCGAAMYAAPPSGAIEAQGPPGGEGHGKVEEG